jgi:protein gp37
MNRKLIQKTFFAALYSDFRNIALNKALQSFHMMQIYFVFEPLIGPLPNINLDNIDWVIVGGESGRKPRPMQEDWVLDIFRALSGS